MTDEPTDAEIEALLLAVPEDRWSALWAAADAVDPGGPHATVAGGEQVGTTLVDGEERPVFQLHYHLYSDDLERLLQALRASVGVVPFPWTAWHGLTSYQGGRGLDTAPVADAARMVTAVIRGERFSDGTIAAALADGTLHAVVSRLRRWHDHERR